MRERFPGGVCFCSPGQDATVVRVIEQISLAVYASNGHNTCEKIREQTKLDVVLALMLSWFGEKVCLFIFDDIWARNDSNKKILHQLSVLGATAARANEEKSRIL